MTRPVEVAGAQTNAVGEAVCGDAYVVTVIDGVTTIGVADGLGHGEEAAVASSAFCEHVRTCGDAGLEEIMHAAREPLAGTRGAAATLVRVDPESAYIEYVGVGNIGLHAHSETRIKPVSVPGIVGRHVRKVLSFRYELNGGALLVLFSDGVSTHFSLADYLHLDPQEMAEAIVRDHGRGYDDATCVVVRC